MPGSVLDHRWNYKMMVGWMYIYNCPFLLIKRVNWLTLPGTADLNPILDPSSSDPTLMIRQTFHDSIVVASFKKKNRKKEKKAVGVSPVVSNQATKFQQHTVVKLLHTTLFVLLEAKMRLKWCTPKHSLVFNSLGKIHFKKRCYTASLTSTHLPSFLSAILPSSAL